MTTTNLPPLPTTERPCPAWCAMTPGHGFESFSFPGDDLPTAARFHSATVGLVRAGGKYPSARVDVSQEEVVERIPGRRRDEYGDVVLELVGPSMMEQVYIDLGEVDPLTPAAARLLAAELLAAAVAVESWEQA